MIAIVVSHRLLIATKNLYSAIYLALRADELPVPIFIELPSLAKGN